MSDFGGSSYAPEGEVSKEERTMSMVAHLLGLIGVFTGIFGFVGPLVIYLIKKDESAFVAQNAMQALAFNIFMAVMWMICLAIAFITCGFGTLLFIPLYIVYLIYVVVAAIRSNDGVVYQYPLSSSFVK
jgi:uncharacterized Tic20 family protein